MAVVPSSDRNARLAALLARVAMGDPRAFGDLYGETSAHLYGAALRILNDVPAAEEILQEAYVSIWQHAGSYEVARSQPLTWLTTIVRNRCLDQLGRRETGTVTPATDADAAPDSDLPTAATMPAEMLSASAEAAAVRGCVDALDAGPKRAIALAFHRGLSHAELARHLREPRCTVKAWVRRGLDGLKSCLDGAGDARAG